MEATSRFGCKCLSILRRRTQTVGDAFSQLEVRTAAAVKSLVGRVEVVSIGQTSYPGQQLCSNSELPCSPAPVLGSVISTTEPASRRGHGFLWPLGLALLAPTLAATELTVCAADEDDAYDELEQIEELDVEGAANMEGDERSDSDSSISDMEGDDPEDESPDQTNVILTKLAAVRSDATRRLYRANRKDYQRFWERRHLLKAGTTVSCAAVTKAGVGKFVVAKRKRSHSWLNNHMKAFQWVFRAYKRPADATVPDLRRLAVVEDTMKFAKEKSANRAKDEYEDRQKGLSAGYSPQEYCQISEYWLNMLRKGHKGDSREPPPFTALQLRADFLWLNTALGRGQDAYNRQLPDQFVYNMPYVGPDQADVFATVTRNGKTNKNARAEFIGALRNRNVMICCVGAEAMRTIWRFHIEKNPSTSSPDFSSKQSWYDTPVAPGRATKKNPHGHLTYNTYYKYFRAAFEANNISSDKVVHAGRGHGTRAAAAAGADPRELQSLGRWTYANFDMSYLTSLPPKALVIQAGVNKDDTRGRPLLKSYIVPRGRVQPPDELLQLLLPWLDAALAAIKERNVRGRASDRDLAAEGVLLRWKKERVIFLQDAAVLWSAYQDLTIYQLPVFKHPKWEPFRQEVLAMCERYKDLAVDEVDDSILPAEVATALIALEERIIALHDQLAEVRAQENAGSREREEGLRSAVEELGRKMDQLTQQVAAAAPTVCTACGHRHEAPAPSQAEVGGGSGGASTSGAANIPPAAGAGRSAQVRRDEPNVPATVTYDLGGVKSVRDVVDLFERDDPTGRRSLLWMEENGPKNWRAQQKIPRQRFDDIKVIYDGVCALAIYRRRTVETAANLLEDLQRRERFSFRQLRLFIRKKRVEAKERHKEAVEEVKEARIERDFGEMLSAECSP